MTIAEQQIALDNIDVDQLRLHSALTGGALSIPTFYLLEGAYGGVSGGMQAKQAMNQAPGFQTMTSAQRAKFVASIAKERAQQMAKASLRSPVPYAFAAGHFLYENVNPQTAQASMDATDTTMDTAQLYQ